MAPNIATRTAPNAIDPSSWSWYRRHSSQEHFARYDPETVTAHYLRAAGARFRPAIREWNWDGASLWMIAITAVHLSIIIRGTASHADAAIAQLLIAAAATAALKALAKHTPHPTATTTTSLAAYAALGPETHWYSVPALTATAAIHGGEILRAHLQARDARRSMRFPLPSLTYGQPGGVASEGGKYGAGAVKAGARGEKATAKLMELLLAIPGTTVVHGLRFPGSADADVDHVAINGPLVILVDSKQFRGGSYRWAPDGNVIENTRTGTRYTNHMASAIRGYRRVLEGKADVHAVVLIHGKGATVTGPHTRDGVRLAVAEDAMAHMGNLLDREYRRSRGRTDNARIVGKVLLNLKRQR